MQMQVSNTIQYHATGFDIEQAILKAIIEQESHFNPYALRYEPEYPYLVNPIHYAEKLSITLATETLTQKMSWGLGQIMGGLARDLGFEDHIGKLFDPETNIEYICKNLIKIKDHTKSDQELFACYNGGLGALFNKKDGQFPNQGYVDSCMNHLEKWRKG